MTPRLDTALRMIDASDDKQEVDKSSNWSKLSGELQELQQAQVATYGAFPNKPTTEVILPPSDSTETLQEMQQHMLPRKSVLTSGHVLFTGDEGTIDKHNKHFGNTKVATAATTAVAGQWIHGQYQNSTLSDPLEKKPIKVKRIPNTAVPTAHQVVANNRGNKKASKADIKAAKLALYKTNPLFKMFAPKT